MIDNPFLPSPPQAAAWAEGFTKGFVATSSPEPSDNVGPDDIDAFNQGVAAGEESASSGVEMGDLCIPALEEHGPGHGPEIFVGSAHIAHGLWEARHLAKLAGGTAGILAGLFEIASTLPVHTLPPEQVLPQLGQRVINMLQSIGVDSMELFCGAGLDVNATDCEIRMSPLFVSQGQARQAAIDMERPDWVVASWRTDQSGSSFRLVDSN